MNHSVYIASPFFKPEQISRLEFIKNCLEQQGVNYFSPMDEFVCPPDASGEVREQTFEANCEAICTSDFIIAVTDGKDVGTIFEAGFAFCFGIPIVYFCETLPPGAPFNLMLSESAWRVVTSRTELSNMSLIPGDLEYQKYEGIIE
jgi:nucleoside 2-deoxyribosyltransferase